MLYIKHVKHALIQAHCASLLAETNQKCLNEAANFYPKCLNEAENFSKYLFLCNLTSWPLIYANKSNNINKQKVGNVTVNAVGQPWLNPASI